LRLFRLLKLIRYSPALQTLKRVVADEWRAARRAFADDDAARICLDLIYFPERSAQPEHFGSILASAGWALETLTAVGYGDVTPMTPLGKMFGGIVMLFGLCMFALPVAIIATGFNQEAARHEFMVTWSMVARVPLFSTLDAAEVAEVTKLLYTRAFQPGRLDRVPRRARRRHVSDRQRRGHGLRGAPDTPSS